MKKWQDLKEELLIIWGLFVFEPIMIVGEIILEMINKILKRKKCGDEE